MIRIQSAVKRVSSLQEGDRRIGYLSAYDITNDSLYDWSVEERHIRILVATTVQSL